MENQIHRKTQPILTNISKINSQWALPDTQQKKMALFNIPRTKHDSYHWYSSLSQLETLVAWIPIYLIFYLGQSSCLQDIRYLSRISLPVFCLHKYYISWQYTERQLWFGGFLFVCLHSQESEAIWQKAQESPI